MGCWSAPDSGVQLRQIEYDCLRSTIFKLLSQINGKKSINNVICLKCFISVRGGHCGYSSREPRNHARPLPRRCYCLFTDVERKTNKWRIEYASVPITVAKKCFNENLRWVSYTGTKKNTWIGKKCLEWVFRILETVLWSHNKGNLKKMLFCL